MKKKYKIAEISPAGAYMLSHRAFDTYEEASKELESYQPQVKTVYVITEVFIYEPPTN